jgi:hypothetical protein
VPRIPTLSADLLNELRLHRNFVAHGGRVGEQPTFSDPADVHTVLSDFLLRFQPAENATRNPLRIWSASQVETAGLAQFGKFNRSVAVEGIQTHQTYTSAIGQMRLRGRL